MEIVDENDTPKVFMNHVLDDSLIVAKHTEELRVINVLIHGVEVIATLDDGSQIISIHQDRWEKTGLLIHSDKIMIMDSANKSRDETMGLLQDLKITIGGYDFYLQVQVVRDAPYEMLLGRPFFTLTSASHKHFDCGDSRFMLFNPNTGNKLCYLLIQETNLSTIIPTSPRTDAPIRVFANQ